MKSVACIEFLSLVFFFVRFFFLVILLKAFFLSIWPKKFHLPRVVQAGLVFFSALVLFVNIVKNMNPLSK